MKLQILFILFISCNKPNNEVYNDAYLISNLIIGECTTCSDKDIEYITYTIINRKRSDKFPNTVKEVIFENNQFKSLNRKVTIDNTMKPIVYDIVLEALKESNIPEVYFFISVNCNSTDCKKILNKRTRVLKTKNHIYLK